MLHQGFQRGLIPQNVLNALRRKMLNVASLTFGVFLASSGDTLLMLCRRCFRGRNCRGRLRRRRDAAKVPWKPLHCLM